MSIDLRVGIVRILTSDHKIVGTGFVASSSGLIATCAHVVDAARQWSAPDEPLYLAFHATNEEREFQVLSQYWRKSDAEDVAILQVAGDLPVTVQPFVLGSSDGKSGHAFKTFGFPDDIPGGMYGYGTIGDLVFDAGGQRLLQMTGAEEVTHGFSGAPVLEIESERIVGMVSAITKPDENGRMSTTAFITPAKVLIEICPLLKVPDTCPYRGVDPFTETNAPLFKGRGEVVEKLVRCLQQDERFLAVLGPSGCGKSSVIRAGLIPELRKGAIRESTSWGVVVTCPVTCPPDYPVNPFNPSSNKGIAIEARDLTHEVSAWLAQHSDLTRLVLIIDQFEELLVACPQAQRISFAQQLSQLLEANLPLSIIVVLREDFYGECIEQNILTDWLEPRDQQRQQAIEDLSRALQTLKETDVRAIVLEPAKSVELQLEEGLVEIIVNDAMRVTNSSMGDERIVDSTILPLLEVALTHLWEKRDEDGLVTRKAYTAIGKMTAGLQEWAFQVFEDFERVEEQQVISRIFTDLVFIGDENQPFPDIRPLPLALLCRTDDEKEEVHRLVCQLARRRLLVTSLQNKQARVEIIHKALLWEWERLRGWLEKDAKFLIWHQELLRKAQTWDRGNAEDATKRAGYRLIVDGPDLEQAVGYLNTHDADLRPIERDFIKASKGRQERVERVTRRTVLSGFVTLIAVPYLGSLIWAALPRHTSSPLYTYTNYHDSVFAVAWSPDKNYDYIAAGSSDPDNLLSVWKAEDGTDVLTYKKSPGGIVTGVAWSPDGKYLASASDDRSVQVWEAMSGKLYRNYSGMKQNPFGHSDQVHSVAWSPDGRYLASGSNDRTVRVWDLLDVVVDSENPYIYLGHDFDHNGGYVWHVAWSPDGTRIASASSDKTVRVWDAHTGKDHFTYRGHTDQVFGVSWSPDGTHIASCGQDKTVQIWDAVSAQTKYTFRGHKGAVHDVSWSSDGKYIVSASADQTAQVWGATKSNYGNIKLICTGHADLVRSITWSPDGTRVASGSLDATVKVWRVVYSQLPIWDAK